MKIKNKKKKPDKHCAGKTNQIPNVNSLMKNNKISVSALIKEVAIKLKFKFR